VNRLSHATPDGSLAMIATTVVIGIAVVLHGLSASAQTAKDIKGPTPLVAIPNEPPAKLIVDPPIPEQQAVGQVFIQYRTENLRIVSVFGKAALEVSPRVGHLHYYVDDQSWPIVDSSSETADTGIADISPISGGCFTAVIAPDGSILGQPIRSGEGEVIVDLDFTLIDKRKHIVDTRGHYSRPELFSLLTDRTPAAHLHDRDTPCKSGPQRVLEIAREEVA